MIQEHGLDAPIFAGQRADGLIDDGDIDGFLAWRAIIRRIETLLRPAGEHLH
jgi:hypothetical protein